MLKKFTTIFGGDPVRRELEQYQPFVEEINSLETSIQQLSDDELKAKTEEFKARLEQGESLDDLLPEAFAVVREVSIRTIGLRHFDVQLIGGVVLHRGRIAEMRTGEGKTLVATMPIYLNALEGKGVHLITVNDYLARRDARWMGPIFDFFGLSVGILQEASRTENGKKAFIYDPGRESTQEDIHQLRLVDRKLAYAADITYGTNNEFGFDYLRDNMARQLDARSQRGHHFAILDEVDNILIDEARTPLIISGPSHEDPEQYQRMSQVVKQLRPEDLEVSERDRTVALTEIGENHAEQILGVALRDPDRPEDITPEQARMLGHLEQAMRSMYLYKRNKDYVVQSGKVVIVDSFTGRLMAGRRWSDGLHQAVEAKEGVRIRQENVTYATITLQNYFRMYSKLSGMTGTAITEAEEFNDIYNVDVTPLPTNLEYRVDQADADLAPLEFKEDGNKFICYTRKGDLDQLPIFWQRKDYPDVVFRTEEAKLRAVTGEILRRHVLGQPILVGTTSVELSERISRRLRAELLRKLANVMVLRSAYLVAHDLPDEGMKIDELMPLYGPLEGLNPSEMRPMARELEVALNPGREENVSRLLMVMGLDETHRERLVSVLEGGIRHSVLNAKKHDEESRIIADAGALGAVTIATNMAGRGVDIKLGGEIAEEVLAAVARLLRRSGVKEPDALSLEERLESLAKMDEEAIGIYGAEVELFQQFMKDEQRVIEVGGLHVLGSERHESRRIDNQLRGRAARQGDPGSSQFFLSLEDELMRLFGGSQVSGLMERLNIDESMPIAHNIVNRTIEQAQSRVEGANFDTRKHLLEYDDVLNQQREVYYGQRDRTFTKDDLSEDVGEMLQLEIERRLETSADVDEDTWKLLAWLEEVQPTLNLAQDESYPSYMLRLLIDEISGIDRADQLQNDLLQISKNALDAQLVYYQNAVEEQIERALDRLDDQVSQRVELAEMAIEGAEIEAEEQDRSPEAKDLVQLVENAAGMRLRMDKASLQGIQEDPDVLRNRIPELIEASLALRVWSGLIAAVESRIGESLQLDPTLKVPVDWDTAEDSLQNSLESVWGTRSERLLADIQRDLEIALREKPQLNEHLFTRLLIQMSYGQRTFFDKKTHQKRALRVARLSYPFFAADLVPDGEELVLQDTILGHLRGAQAALKSSLGRSELQRFSGNKFTDLDPTSQKSIRSLLDETDLAVLNAGATLGTFSEDLQVRLAGAIGQTMLTGAYRRIILSEGDRLWVDYLTQIEGLRTAIGLEAYGQRDPLVQYKSRAFDMFKLLLTEIRTGVVSQIFRVAPPSAGGNVPSRPAGGAGAKSDDSQPGAVQPEKKRKRRRKRR
jgi:preprotein translocase subunit SecA